MNPRKYSSSPLLFAAALLVCGPSVAQQPYAYPNAGQTEAQQSQDRFECHQWSTAQSGFDPSSAAPLPARSAALPPPPPPPQTGYSDQRQSSGGGGFLGMGSGGMFQGGGMLGDAATGAALGAAGGALAGNAGKGAAVGALAGTALGVFSRGTSQPAAAAPPPSNDYYYQQQQAQAAQADQEHQQRMQLVGEYNRAYSACMTARNYTVN